MKDIIKFLLKNYFQALAVLLFIFGSILWFRPERAAELIEITLPLSIVMRFWVILLFNFMWCISFILFDLWNSYRVKGIGVIKLDNLNGEK